MIQIKVVVVVVVVVVTHLWLLKRNFLPNLWGHDNSQLLMGTTCQTYGNMIWQQLLMGTTCHTYGDMIWQQLLMGTTCHDNSQVLLLMGLTCHNWAIDFPNWRERFRMETSFYCPFVIVWKANKVEDDTKVLIWCNCMILHSISITSNLIITWQEIWLSEQNNKKCYI